MRGTRPPPPADVPAFCSISAILLFCYRLVERRRPIGWRRGRAHERDAAEASRCHRETSAADKLEADPLTSLESMDEDVLTMLLVRHLFETNAAGFEPVDGARCGRGEPPPPRDQRCSSCAHQCSADERGVWPEPRRSRARKSSRPGRWRWARAHAERGPAARARTPKTPRKSPGDVQLDAHAAERRHVATADVL